MTSPKLQLCDKTELHCQTILNGSPAPSPRLDEFRKAHKTSTLHNLQQPSCVRYPAGQPVSMQNIDTVDLYGDDGVNSQQQPADELYLNCKNIVGGHNNIELFSVVSDHAEVHSTEDGVTEPTNATWFDNAEPSQQNAILEHMQVVYNKLM